MGVVKVQVTVRQTILVGCRCLLMLLIFHSEAFGVFRWGT